VAPTLDQAIDSRAAAFAHGRIIERIWARDYTVWKPDPTELADRLGWLDVAAESLAKREVFERFAAEAAADGLQSVLLLGMGGSSLGPEVIREVFGKRLLDLVVLDSTHPQQIRETETRLDLTRTLVLVSSKSGSTIETACQAEYFWSRVGDGRQFAAITDPGSKLAATARERGFRRVFENRPDIGGRYSVLSDFGMLPAALVGAPTETILRDAIGMAGRCGELAVQDNPGACLGVLLGEAALAGRDKCMLVLPPGLKPLGAWIEQLIAESTGKEGRGILPVPVDTVGPPSAYGPDRVFVAYESSAELRALEAAGHPVAVLEDAGLGGEFFRWEFATAVAGAVLGVQPFDQPNVQEAKDAAGVILSGRPPEVAPMPLAALLGAIEPGDYIAVNAFISRNAENEARLGVVRDRLALRHKVAVTAGFGPRFLHSTGQLHKGGPASGAFIEVVDEFGEDIAIPGRPYTFGELFRAQALGDLAALLGRGRRAAQVTIEELESAL
jgi:transaldolase / glucose-6-phosphate isomerase